MVHLPLHLVFVVETSKTQRRSRSATVAFNIISVYNMYYSKTIHVDASGMEWGINDEYQAQERLVMDRFTRMCVSTFVIFSSQSVGFNNEGKISTMQEQVLFCE